MRFKIIITIALITPLLYAAYSKSEDAYLFPEGSWIKVPIEMPEPEKIDTPSSSEDQRLLPGKEKTEGSTTGIDGTEKSMDRKVHSRSQSAPAGSSDSDKEIKEIRFKISGKDEESVLFVLNGSHSPDIFVLEGDQPRVVCDFPGAHIDKKIARQVQTNGKIIRQIRFGFYDDPKPRLRVVLDLVPDKTKDFEIQPVFFDDLNIYAIVVR